ncbi:hypothetical protein A2774_02920 [Candidatus Roizmanbacteria bacterium RIFCSPHIGHO2_01_FULL_39_12c]|uniref:Peptidase M20 dimerisation domain-containing protein n=1 Tax=Candidatus Roizmanbacteria bacterium RIFCSPHIGHO2_01_FULL_39_12c TaxID=1802031 RepID=A0A1F7GCU0_9BACT|nr:MAG: hypothetical protein A2774_02920 [Candidatus Roizmanbacteria bacterium RIFCSPHIGHO2_01_FULL_39_12c]OGK47449.1 MAG: hypothetical protein A2963_04820 [Candidatus Roizmanbacteria bacterium RIFCSPLOWO2_01_FULL_40_13]
MINDVLPLLKQLIVIESTKDKPQQINEILKLAKYQLSGFTASEFTNYNSRSLLYQSEKTKSKQFRVILNAHLDVIPGKPYQFKPFEKDGKLHGRGAYDMKAAAAVEILIFKELANKVNYPLGLQLVTDEEVGGLNGTKYQIDKGVKTDFVISGEPTDFKIGNKAKGIIWLKIKTKGKTGHAAYPWQAKNAVWKMIDLLYEIKKVYPEFESEVWKTTVNLAKTETTNLTFNKVPDECSACLDIRYIPEDKDRVISKLREIIKNKAELELLLNEPSVYTNGNSKFIVILRKSIHKVAGTQPQFIAKHGGSDVRHFNQAGCAGVTFGPIGYGQHTDNEWVDTQGLSDYYKILKAFLLSLN